MKEKTFIGTAVALTCAFAYVVETTPLDDPGLGDITSSFPERITSDGSRLTYKDHLLTNTRVNVAALGFDGERSFVVLNTKEMRSLPKDLRHAVDAHEWGHYLEGHHIDLYENKAQMKHGFSDPTTYKFESDAHCHGAVDLKEQGFGIDTVHNLFSYISNGAPLEERSTEVKEIHNRAIKCFNAGEFTP
jgi:hypothetical protein